MEDRYEMKIKVWAHRGASAYAPENTVRQAENPGVYQNHKGGSGYLNREQLTEGMVHERKQGRGKNYEGTNQ